MLVAGKELKKLLPPLFAGTNRAAGAFGLQKGGINYTPYFAAACRCFYLFRSAELENTRYAD